MTNGLTVDRMANGMTNSGVRGGLSDTGLRPEWWAHSKRSDPTTGRGRSKGCEMGRSSMCRRYNGRPVLTVKSEGWVCKELRLHSLCCVAPWRLWLGAAVSFCLLFSRRMTWLALATVEEWIQETWVEIEWTVRKLWRESKRDDCGLN